MGEFIIALLFASFGAMFYFIYKMVKTPDETKSKKYALGFVLSILIPAILVVIVLFVLPSGSSNNNYMSEDEYHEYKEQNNNDKGGEFGHGEQYDRDVYYVADQFYN